LLAEEEGPTGFLPAHLTSNSGKKNTAWDSYLEGLSTQYFSAKVTYFLRFVVGSKQSIAIAEEKN